MYQKKRLGIFIGSATLIAIVLAGLIIINPLGHPLLDDPNALLQLLITKVLKVTGLTALGDSSHWYHVGLLVIASMLTLVVEMFILGWERCSIRKIVISKSKSTQNDIWGWVIDMLNLYDLLTFVLSFGLLHAFSFAVKQVFDLNLIVNIESAILQFSIIFVVGDLKNYVRHRFSHEWFWFWQLHKYHHSATEFNMIAHRRSHYIESAVSKIFDVIPYVILGAPIQTYFIVKLIHEVHQMFLHSDVDWKWGWVGKYFLVSPAAHKVHHSVDPKHFNTNFGGTFIIWDRMFGSYYEPEAVKAIGIPDNPFNKSNYLKDIYRSYRDFIGVLVSGRKKGVEKLHPPDNRNL